LRSGLASTLVCLACVPASACGRRVAEVLPAELGLTGGDGCNKPEGCVSEVEKQRRAAEIERETERPAPVALEPGAVVALDYGPLRFPRLIQAFDTWTAASLGVEPGHDVSLRLSAHDVSASGCTLTRAEITLQVGYRVDGNDLDAATRPLHLIAGVGSEPMRLASALEYVPWIQIESDRPCETLHVTLAVEAAEAQP
jgi:hypothetical protein